MQFQRLFGNSALTANNDWPTAEDVKEILLDAILAFYENDRDLLDLDVNERSITHKLAEHLQRRLLDWQVDCEYNRHGREPKRLETPYRNEFVDPAGAEAVTVFPDIIIHRRGTDQNLAVIEAKKRGARIDTRDQAKVEAFFRSADYRYRVGFTLVLGQDAAPQVHCFSGEPPEWRDSSAQLQMELEKRGYA